jgi:hypothetical protein
LLSQNIKKLLEGRGVPFSPYFEAASTVEFQEKMLDVAMLKHTVYVRLFSLIANKIAVENVPIEATVGEEIKFLIRIFDSFDMPCATPIGDIHVDIENHVQSVITPGDSPGVYTCS